MADKIICMKQFESGTTATAFETKIGVAIVIGAGTILVDVRDMYDFTRLLKKVDRYFLKR